MNMKGTAFRVIIAVFFLVATAQGARILVSNPVCNPFGGFGVEFSLQTLSLLGGIVLLFGSFVLWKYGHILPLIFFLSGGLSNLFERWQYGCVTDYVRIFHWFPVFNVADVYLTIAGVLLLWEMWENERGERVEVRGEK